MKYYDYISKVYLMKFDPKIIKERNEIKNINKNQNIF